MSKETLDEASEKYSKIFSLDGGHRSYAGQGFIDGAKWQAERTYSEEELFKLTLDAVNLGMTIRQNQLSGYCLESGNKLHSEWFEEIKKVTL